MSRTADLNTSIMLQQRINVCFGEAALQRAGPTRAVILGRSCDFAKVAICAKLPLVQMASNGNSQPKADLPHRHLGRIAYFRCARKLNWVI
jgi:hypothetical protein